MPIGSIRIQAPVVLATALALASPQPAGAAPDPLAGLKAGCERRESAEADPSRRFEYRICSGMVESFDDTALDTTLTLPVGAGGRRLPLVVFLHGFLDSKTEYMSETRRGRGPDRAGVEYKTVGWNNLWFASRGYAVLNYSARGNGDSAGQIGLASKDLEVEDTRHLTGLLADDRDSSKPLARIRPRRIAALGSSYGGGQTWLLLTTRGEGAPAYGSWLSPSGRTLELAAAVPQYTWTDLLYALAPSGHHLSSGVDRATATEPFGVGKQTLVDGFLATAGTKFTPEVVSWLARFNVGEPYDDPNDPITPTAKRELTERRSAFYQDGFFRALDRGRVRRVPVLAAQGWTDPIFTAIEPLRMYRELRAADPRYPIGMYFGDFEHLTAQVKIPDLRHFHALGTRMLDHYLLSRGPRPRLDVSSAVTRCDPERFGPVLKARSWGRLHPIERRFDFGGTQQTISPLNDPRGPQLDPVALSQTGRGCIRTSAAAPPGVATYTVPVTRAFTTAGLPRLRIDYTAVTPDIELNSRLWDVAPDGTWTLVDRGAYRAVSPDPTGDVAAYEMFGNSWRFRRGHQILLEIVQDDSTYLRRDNFASTATISHVTLTLPVARLSRDRAGA
ncbi:MAG: CocE/NonD family hydrolase [Solirubrobacterales bacterium]